MKIFESSENYLERILMLKEQKGFAIAVDIANALNVSKASVSVALKKLNENGYVTVDDNNHINLTKKGHEIAKEIYDRHKFLTDWLIALGVSPEVAREDACKLEHGLSKESFLALQGAAKKDLEKCEECFDIHNY